MGGFPQRHPRELWLDLTAALLAWGTVPHTWEASPPFLIPKNSLSESRALRKPKPTVSEFSFFFFFGHTARHVGS